MTADGSELLAVLKRIAEAGERIAEHLTKQGMSVLPGRTPEKPRRHYNEATPQPEQTDAEGLRPKQASRS